MPFDRSTDLDLPPETSSWTLADGSRLQCLAPHAVLRRASATPTAAPSRIYLLQSGSRRVALDLGQLIADRRDAAVALRDAQIDAVLRGLLRRLRAWLAPRA